MILRNHHDRYKQRSQSQRRQFLFLIVALIAICTLAYNMGQLRNENLVKRYQTEWQTLQARAERAEATKIDLETNLQTLSLAHQQLEDTYKKDIPQGDLGLLTSLIKEQLDKGTSVDRLAFVIRQAQPPQNCTQPVSKRFILQTPHYKGPKSSVSFADGTITVTGDGIANQSTDGTADAWFDPGKRVRIIFTQLGGQAKVVDGLLPLHHTIIINSKEHRFTVSEGPRSFVLITADQCDYPLALQKLDQRKKLLEQTKPQSQSPTE